MDTKYQNGEMVPAGPRPERMPPADKREYDRVFFAGVALMLRQLGGKFTVTAADMAKFDPATNIVLEHWTPDGLTLEVVDKLAPVPHKFCRCSCPDFATPRCFGHTQAPWECGELRKAQQIK